MKVLLAVFIFILCGCSSIKFNSNGGEYVINKIENNIRKSGVKRYTNYEVWELGASQIGHVESEYCQVDLRDNKPNQHALISSLEVKAQLIGGNALVFDSCFVNTTTASCHNYTKCQGMAYLVKY